MRLIGMAGYLGSGKDTTGRVVKNIVENELGGKAVTVGFADLLKLSAARLFVDVEGIDDGVYFCDWMKNPGVEVKVVYNGAAAGPVDRTTLSGREFLQRYGTESHRNVFGTDFWVDALMKDIEVPLRHEMMVIITDVRFENEAEAVLKSGGEVWRVLRPLADRSVSSMTHVSEKPLPEKLISRFIVNGGTVDELADSVREGTKTVWYS